MVTKSKKPGKAKAKGGAKLKLGKETVKNLTGGSRTAAKSGTRTQGRDIFAPPGTSTNCTCTCKPYAM